MKKVNKLDDNTFKDNSKAVSIGVINSKLISIVSELNLNLTKKK